MGGPKEAKNPGVSQSERRPYRAPRLRQLGSVRELTLGATMGSDEGGGTYFPKGGAANGLGLGKGKGNGG